MERLEKLVSKHHEEHIPLIKPIAEEIIEVDSSFDEEDESGNPRIKRIKRCLKGPYNFYNWKCLQEHPHNTLFNSVIFISSLVWGVIGGIKLYHMYY
jgi:hypothetical protein